MKNLLLVRSNLRKAKGQTVTVVILLLLSALMLNLWLMLSTDYKQNFDRYHDKLNAEHILLAANDDSTEFRQFLTQTIESDKRTSDFSISSCIHMVGIFKYNSGEVNSNFVILEKEDAVSRSIGKIEIVEDSDIQSGIYMPMLYKSDDIDIGKKITISFGSNKAEYTVCGFFNSIMAGSHNCSMCELVLTKDKYDELEDTGYAPKAALCSVRIKDKADSENYQAMLNKAVSSRNPDVYYSSNSYALVSQSRYISQMICSGIMSALAFFILLIALAVMMSNVVNYIQDNMKILGTLKAVGYTGGQLIFSLLLQFTGIALIVIASGVGISYIIFPYLNAMMISQTGIPYTVRFLPFPMIISVLVLGGAVSIAVWLSARRIKKIEPITALRQGVQTHNFKRNRFPLEKTYLPVNIALALKTMFSSMKSNLIVCITMLVLSLVVVFSGVMTKNMITDMTPFINLVVGETADACINVNTEAEEAFLREMNSDERVEKIYLYNAISVSHAGSVELIATICDDFSKVNNQSFVFEGRFPKYDNEIAVAAKYAQENNLNIGDEISVTAAGEEEKYIISGFTQMSNNLGKDCLLTKAGYERLGKLQNVGYYLNLSDSKNTDKFISEVKERFGKEVNVTVNIDAVVDAAASVYVSLMTVIVIAMLVLCTIVIVFVLYLLVRIMLNSKKRDYGIMKSLGFTSRQLVFQTAISFMPSVIISTAIGLTLSSLIVNPLTALFLRGIGVVKCTFAVPVGFITAAGIGIILFVFVIVCLLSLRIKKIAPKVLIIGE